MKIEDYKNLISQLPVREQCFTTKLSTWKKYYEEIGWLKDINEKLFGDQDTLTLSREDIFDSRNGNIREFILKVIYWGYTAGMRGNNFKTFLADGQLYKLENLLTELREQQHIVSTDMKTYIKQFSEISGVGLSTYSKFLYFLGVKVDGSPCIIVDARLINVFQSKCYEEFRFSRRIREDNKEELYIETVKEVNDVAKILGTSGENVEQFLFMFGNNLKRPNLIS